MSRSRTRVPLQSCPICQALHPPEATHCDQCGAALSGAPAVTSPQPYRRATPRTISQFDGPTQVDWAEGEADLYEGVLPAARRSSTLVGLVALALALVAGMILLSQFSPVPLPATPTVVAFESTLDESLTTSTPTRRAAPPTNTKIVVIPTIALPTVTQAPPTPTQTPTRGPCIQKARRGDTVYALAARCGHKDLGIVPLILALNNLQDEKQLQINQALEIPWPTPTGGAPGQVDIGLQPGTAGTMIANLEPTLPPGVMWYGVRKGETASSIVFKFNASMKILRDLNPEINFSQCDFGVKTGGPACTVILVERQRIRVPAPTPTPTVSPTLSGSETPSPSPTPTFNAPFSQSPGENMQFEAFELPTLRWVASGQLAPNEVYLVTAIDRTANLTYTATTRDLSFELPATWQATDGKRHTFEWSVAIASLNASGTPVPLPAVTETRTFTWQGRSN